MFKCWTNKPVTQLSSYLQLISHKLISCFDLITRFICVFHYMRVSHKFSTSIIDSVAGGNIIFCSTWISHINKHNKYQIILLHSFFMYFIMFKTGESVYFWKWNKCDNSLKDGLILSEILLLSVIKRLGCWI